MVGSMPSLADIAAVTKNEDGFGGNNGWWILIILFALFRGNWGNDGNNGEIQRGFDTQSILSKLDGISNGISSLGYDQLNQMNGIQNTINQNTNAITSQLQNCCCEQKTGQMQILNQMGSDTCAITNAINQAAQNIMNNDNCNYHQLHDENVALQIQQYKERIAEQQSLINALNLAQSQSNQNSYLLAQIKAMMNGCDCGC